MTGTEKDGTVWVRHLCRSCRKVVLWEVLGEPTPICSGCKSEGDRTEPMGVYRVDRINTGFTSQERQYHGDRPHMDV